MRHHPSASQEKRSFGQPNCTSDENEKFRKNRPVQDPRAPLRLLSGKPDQQGTGKNGGNRGRMLLIIRMRWILLVTVCAYGLYAGSLLFSSHPDYSAGISLLAVPVGTLLAAISYNLFYQLFYQELEPLRPGQPYPDFFRYPRHHDLDPFLRRHFQPVLGHLPVPYSGSVPAPGAQAGYLVIVPCGDFGFRHTLRCRDRGISETGGQLSCQRRPAEESAGRPPSVVMDRRHDRRNDTDQLPCRTGQPHREKAS